MTTALIEMPGVFPGVVEKYFARSSYSAGVLEMMTARIGMPGVFPGVVEKCFAYCYYAVAFGHFIIAFYLMKLPFSLLGNDASKELGARRHCVWFGFSIEFSL